MRQKQIVVQTIFDKKNLIDFSKIHDIILLALKI